MGLVGLIGLSPHELGLLAKFIFTLPHEILLATLAWTWTVQAYDIGNESKSRRFLLMLLFWAYFSLTAVVNCLVSFYVLDIVRLHLPTDAPNSIIATFVGMLGMALGTSLFSLSFKPFEGVDVGPEKLLSKLRSLIIDRTIEKKADADKRNLDEFAAMLSDAIKHEPELEAEYMRIVGNTVGAPGGLQAVEATKKMAQYKASGHLYTYHLARSMISADMRESLRFLRRLYWKRGGLWNRVYRYLGKGVVKTTFMLEFS